MLIGAAALCLFGAGEFKQRSQLVSTRVSLSLTWMVGGAARTAVGATLWHCVASASCSLHGSGYGASYREVGGADATLLSSLVRSPTPRTKAKPEPKCFAQA